MLADGTKSIAQILREDLEYNNPKNVIKRELEEKKRTRDQKLKAYNKTSTFEITFDFVDPDAECLYNDEVV